MCSRGGGRWGGLEALLEMTLVCSHELSKEWQHPTKVTTQPEWGSKLPFYSKPGQGGAIPTP